MSKKIQYIVVLFVGIMKGAEQPRSLGYPVIHPEVARMIAQQREVFAQAMQEVPHNSLPRLFERMAQQVAIRTQRCLFAHRGLESGPASGISSGIMSREAYAATTPYVYASQAQAVSRPEDIRDDVMPAFYDMHPLESPAPDYSNAPRIARGGIESGAPRYVGGYHPQAAPIVSAPVQPSLTGLAQSYVAPSPFNAPDYSNAPRIARGGIESGAPRHVGWHHHAQDASIVRAPVQPSLTGLVQSYVAPSPFKQPMSAEEVDAIFADAILRSHNEARSVAHSSVEHTVVAAAALAGLPPVSHVEEEREELLGDVFSEHRAAPIIRAQEPAVLLGSAESHLPAGAPVNNFLPEDGRPSLLMGSGNRGANVSSVTSSAVLLPPASEAERVVPVASAVLHNRGVVRSENTANRNAGLSRADEDEVADVLVRLKKEAGVSSMLPSASEVERVVPVASVVLYDGVVARSENTANRNVGLPRVDVPGEEGQDEVDAILRNRNEAPSVAHSSVAPHSHPNKGVRRRTIKVFAPGTFVPAPAAPRKLKSSPSAVAHPMVAAAALAGLPPVSHVEEEPRGAVASAALHNYVVAGSETSRKRPAVSYEEGPDDVVVGPDDERHERELPKQARRADFQSTLDNMGMSWTVQKSRKRYEKLRENMSVLQRANPDGIPDATWLDGFNRKKRVPPTKPAPESGSSSPSQAQREQPGSPKESQQ